MDKEVRSKRFWLRVYENFLSLEEREREPVNILDKLQTSIKVTAKSRYRASRRLKFVSKMTFYTSVLFSLGLIAIPLMQLSGICLFFNDRIINGIQIFLAISVLIYSIIIHSSNFDVRSEKLNDCGDKLKDIIRESDREVNDKKISDDDLKRKHEEISNRYSDIVSESENHLPMDYALARLEMTRDYQYSWLKKLVMFVRGHFGLSVMFPLAVSLLLLIVEGVFITDMLNITEFFHSVFNKN